MAPGPIAQQSALKIADESYAWYRRAAIRSRRNHRIAEISTVVLSATIPVVAIFSPDSATVPALLGALIAVVTGFKGIFRWHDNYLRFSRSREAVEAERRKYRWELPPYGDASSRDGVLISSITSLENEEMSEWAKLHDGNEGRQPKQT